MIGVEQGRYVDDTDELLVKILASFYEKKWIFLETRQLSNVNEYFDCVYLIYQYYLDFSNHLKNTQEIYILFSQLYYIFTTQN
jgi:hypothetical protein